MICTSFQCQSVPLKVVSFLCQWSFWFFALGILLISGPLLFPQLRIHSKFLLRLSSEIVRLWVFYQLPKFSVVVFCLWLYPYSVLCSSRSSIIDFMGPRHLFNQLPIFSPLKCYGRVRHFVLLLLHPNAQFCRWFCCRFLSSSISSSLSFLVSSSLVIFVFWQNFEHCLWATVSYRFVRISKSSSLPGLSLSFLRRTFLHDETLFILWLNYAVNYNN